MTKLFIVGIPRDMDEAELTEICHQYGHVASVKIITDMESGQSKGYGFINMVDELSATAVIKALDGGTIDDRTISVRLADRQQPVQQSQPQVRRKPVRPAGYAVSAVSERRGKRPRKAS
ncbi:RNA-binding protein [Mucilaginibacter sp. UR6-1]|uniref:RNA recognition motif domain-containing protein n=1 Tax=Mucilaginibacter sp. UR6-1 TaxID=1435643 RepID=UPI001E3E4989|nr:RNA-binding protein [Mucilaginibacter sp. UR6-1]MCC8407517.1 RNA-binding protein [Mucilaginibacter sp. UR6-1]